MTALNKLQQVDKVDLIIVWGNTPSGTCAPVAERNKIPLLAMSMNPDAKDRDFVVTLGSPMESLAKLMYQKFKEWQTQNAGAVTIDIGSALIGVDLLKKALAGKLFVETIANEEIDFKSTILKLKAKQIDSILMFTFPKQALTFMRQAKAMNYTPKLVGGDIFAEPLFQQEAKEIGFVAAFAYGSVQDQFLARVKAEYQSLAYFFETATAYALSEIMERWLQQLASSNSQQATLGLTFLKQLQALDLSNQALTGIKFVENKDYGRHFEVEAKVYEEMQ